MRIKIDKSVSFLAMIVLILGGVAAFFLFGMRADEVETAIRDDRIIKVLFILEADGKPALTQILFHYPLTKRSAVLDVPEETGQLLQSIQRMARLDSLYSPSNVIPYRDEISRLAATDVDWFIKMDLDSFSRIVDLVEGLDVFIPNAVDVTSADSEPILLPSGAVRLDGEKSVLFATFADPAEPEAERIARKQKALLAFIKRLGERAADVTSKDTFPLLKRQFSTNLSDSALSRVIGEFSNINVDHIVPQRVSGNRKNLDGVTILFPYYNGELIKDIVKQTLNAITNAGIASGDSRIYTVEILNGTPEKGLAKKTAELFQSFGYDVISVGNADDFEIDKTYIIDRQANPQVAKDFSAVIKCENVKTGIATSQEDVIVDFTVVLGKDFTNGRYVTR